MKPKGMKNYPQDIKEKARTMYASGMKVQAIANELGLTYNCVYQWITATPTNTNGAEMAKMTRDLASMNRNLIRAMDNACAILAKNGCPFIHFNDNREKREYIAEHVCPKCDTCAMDNATFCQCWANYFVGGMDLQ